MKVLVWNCRGVGGPLTIPQLKEVINLHFPSVVFLAETKNQKTIIEKIQKQLKFNNCCVVNSNGKAGGLAMIWKEDIEVISIDQGTFFIGMKMKDSDSGCKWWLVGVYVSTDENTRKVQWKMIEQKKREWGEHWVLVGDFNDIRSGEEKWGGRRRHESSFKEFNRFIKENELVDLGFEGKPWTWCNQWEGEGKVKERLDRFLASVKWYQRFDRARCSHIENEASDHSICGDPTFP
ncbi:uncharacterized protein [Coffea arabica]|uniref:Endonuclease/exonuclease/phosphatase domain-containing protein n=1 Tax=Coffea arabica TaxID=13443 RepID=A0ABM4U656_COFAR